LKRFCRFFKTDEKSTQTYDPLIEGLTNEIEAKNLTLKKIREQSKEKDEKIEWYNRKLEIVRTSASQWQTELKE